MYSTLLCVTIERFSHVVTWSSISSSFILIAVVITKEYLLYYYSLFIHSPAAGHLDGSSLELF